MQRHKEWVMKGKSDLKICKKLLELNDNSILDGVVYHAQQCAEKMFKSFLSANQHKIEKTHNLVVLTKLCNQYDKSFDSLLELAAELTPYSFKFRYPDDLLVPERHDAQNAVIFAEKIYNFILDKNKEIETGQMSLVK